MAFTALGRVTQRTMIRCNRPRIVGRVAAIALRRQSESIELTHRAHLVARIAIDHRVRANQWETILMLVDVVDRDLPPIAVVAQLALRTILSSMQIGVTILALVRRICEVQVCMAIAACHGCMPAAQWKAGVRMVEVDLAWNYRPRLRRVTHVARHRQLAVWTLG